MTLFDGLENLQTVTIRHLKIKNDQIGHQVSNATDGSAGCACKTDDLDAFDSCQKSAQSFCYQAGIINQKYAQRLFAGRDRHCRLSAFAAQHTAIRY